MRRNATKARRGQAQLKAKSSPWPTAKQTNYLSNERGLVCKLKKQSHTHTYLHIYTHIYIRNRSPTVTAMLVAERLCYCLLVNAVVVVRCYTTIAACCLCSLFVPYCCCCCCFCLCFFLFVDGSSDCLLAGGWWLLAGEWPLAAAPGQQLSRESRRVRLLSEVFGCRYR